MLFKGALSATSAAKRHCAIAVVLASLFPAWAADLGGNPRVFLGKPDMGCHENTSRGTLIFVR